MQNGTKIYWDINTELIFLGSPKVNIQSNEALVTGEFQDGYLELDYNRVSHPININYFLDLWNHLYPDDKLSKDQIIIEVDGEHSKLKDAMPPRGKASQNFLTKIGSFAESLVIQGLVPDVEVIKVLSGTGLSYDVDFHALIKGEEFGVELKSNDRMGTDPYKYRLTAYKSGLPLREVVRRKASFAQEFNLRPGMLGMTLDFQANTFDAFFYPGLKSSFRSGAGIELGVDIPFENPEGITPIGLTAYSTPRRVPKRFRKYPEDEPTRSYDLHDPDDFFDLGDRDDRRYSNILDPPQDELDQRLFDGIQPRLDLFEPILYHARQVFRQHGFNPKAFDFYLTGSICTYNYSETSDCDITIVCNVDEFHPVDRADLIAVVRDSLDGKEFPGTNYKFQWFVQPQGVDVLDLFKIGLRNAYDFQNHIWIVEPDETRKHNIRSEYPDWFHDAMQVSDKFNTLLDHEKVKEAYEMFQEIHERRAQDQKLYGDVSYGNIVYKYLVNNGSVDRLRYRGYNIAT